VHIGSLFFEPAWWGRVPAQEWSGERHAHWQVELSYVTDGSGVLELPGGSVEVARGDVILAVPGESHCLRSKPGRLLGLAFGAWLLDIRPVPAHTTGETADELTRLFRGFLGARKRVAADPPGAPVGTLFAALGRELERPRTGWREAGRALSIALLCETARLFVGSSRSLAGMSSAGNWVPVALVKYGRSTEEIASGAMQFIARHYREDLKVEDVARSMGVGVRRIQRVFERQGFNFRRCLHEVRLDNAKFLLAVSPAPVREIARRVGYADAAYFSRIFRAREKRTPREIRAQLRIRPR
jgi:AraC-like DNA-binding protein